MEKLIEALNWIDAIATVVWIILILIMIVILKNIHNLFGSTNAAFKWGIFLVVIVLIYPVYTSFYYQLEIGFLGNVFTLIITLLYRGKLKVLNMKEHNWLVIQIIWLGITSVYVGLMLVNDYLIQ